MDSFMLGWDPMRDRKKIKLEDAKDHHGAAPMDDCR
jgi:hypothetical protein